MIYVSKPFGCALSYQIDRYNLFLTGEIYLKTKISGEHLNIMQI